MKNYKYTNWFLAVVMTVVGFSMTACEDEPDKYEIADGVPTVKYVRSPLPAVSDSFDRCLYGKYSLFGR